MEMNNESVLLRMEGITKEFPGVKALDGVNLTVRAGTVHALMGENGAGKSTLMKCLFGVYKKDGGKIYLEGQEVEFKNSKEALENGVAMVHQTGIEISHTTSENNDITSGNDLSTGIYITKNNNTLFSFQCLTIF